MNAAASVAGGGLGLLVAPVGPVRQTSTFSTHSPSTGPAWIGPMLQLLAQQPSMLMAAMGLDHASSIAFSLYRVRRILAAVDAANKQTAVERWRAKTDAPAAHVLE